MQAVLLMAGKGTRMAKHYEGPKQLLPVLGKPIVEHTLDSLPDEIEDLIFIVGGPHEQKIRDHFSSGEYKGRKITFLVQEEQLGLAHAFWVAKNHVHGRWIGMIADDIISPAGLKQLVQEEMAILAYRVEHPETFGVLVTDEEGYLQYAVEKPQEFVSDLVWTGHMCMDETFMQIEVPPSARGEYETPDVWTKLTKEYGKKIRVVETDFWLPINDKTQLDEAERQMQERGI